jgi:uncharacterized membrane protein YqjE
VSDGNGKSLAMVISEVKEDLKEFLDTRYRMLLAELKQKISVFKVALPGLLLAAMLGLVGFLLLTIALVAAVASAIGWGWSFLIIGAFYCVTAGVVAFIGYREISQVGVAPKRTIKVLQQDKAWLTREAKIQL